MKVSNLEHRFVRHVPEQVAPGVLYVSMEYATAVHSCCCGCGEEIVTPFTPTDWRMTFDGETVSIRPSIGNWNLACRSHYIIDRGRIITAAPWTKQQIEAEQRRDKAAKAAYYGVSAPSAPPAESLKQSLWSRVTGWMRRG